MTGPTRQDVMTENGLHTTTKPLFVTQPCPPSVPCPGAAPEVGPEPYDRMQLSNREAAELTDAKAAADGVVVAARPAIDQATRVLLDCQRDTGAALHRLDDFAKSGDLARNRDAVRRVQERHEHDGPEDRTRRPGWVRWALWLTVPAAGIYDTAFFAAVFLRLVDGRPDLASPEFYIALLPGVVITVALLAAGHWLAEALVRARAHTERRPERIPVGVRLVCLLLRRRPTPRKRARDELPWPRFLLPGVFAFLVLGTLTVWAHNRALEAQVEAATVPTTAVALLLLLFSVTALVVKAIYHNPYADTAHAADRRLAVAAARGDRLATAGGTAVAEFETANNRLRGLLDDVTAQATRRIDQAWTSILRERHAHGLAGTVAPPFAVVGPPSGADRAPLFDGLVEPQVWLTPVHVARTFLRDDEVNADRERLRELMAELATQRADGRSAMSS